MAPWPRLRCPDETRLGFNHADPDAALFGFLTADYDQRLPGNFAAAPQQFEQAMREATAAAFFDGALVDALRDIRGACPPAGFTTDQAKRAVIRYISAKPERMHEYFIVLTSEAIQAAWPCEQQ